MISKYFRTILKSSTTIISIMSLVVGLTVIGSCATGPRVTLQGHTISTLTGQKSTWAHQILDRQIKYSTISGRRARLIQEVMACATSRTDGLVFHSWEVQRLFTKLQSPEIPDLEFYRSLEEMRRRCSQIRLYQYLLTTRSSSNQSKTVWRGPRRNYRIRHHKEDSLEIPSTRLPRRLKKVWTQQSTGRTQGTTRMMGRSSNYSSMTNRVNGRNRTTSSITGGSRKRVLDSEQEQQANA